MCGFIGFSGQLAEKEAVLQRMMARIVHRGPDMGGAYVDEDVALGFRRLSILDLSEAGAQPMKSSDGNVVVTFNGEIYNFMELRRELEEKGHHFHCHADTEVLVHGYEEWGTQLVYRLRGMYGFVIWDKANRRLFGARDMFGIKPFYYSPLPDGKGLLFGSEIKGFLEHPLFQKAVNENALLPYLTLQYSATEETFFKGVYKLPAAHYFTYENGKMEIQRYWDCKFAPKEQSFDACADELDKTVHESVAAHRIADVKVGSFLSGGVDSSYITACLMPDNTFSVGFDYNKFNETNYAAELSEKLGVKNYRKLITAEECFEAFPDIQYHMDEPQSNPSSVPLYFLAKLAREHVTVVLSGYNEFELVREAFRLGVYDYMLKGDLNQWVLEELLDKGNAALISDVGCGALLCRAALESAHMNVWINTSSLSDRGDAARLEHEADTLLDCYSSRAGAVASEVSRRLRKEV